MCLLYTQENTTSVTEYKSYIQSSSCRNTETGVENIKRARGWKRLKQKEIFLNVEGERVVTVYAMNNKKNAVAIFIQFSFLYKYTFLQVQGQN